MTGTGITDGGLFADEIEAVPQVSLADKFGVPPLTTLDRRVGPWQARRREWLALGIESEVGRSEALTFAKHAARTDGFAAAIGAKLDGLDPVSQKLLAVSGGTSVFDPVLCELVYRWFSKPGATVLDPFAGGSVRGIVASVLGRTYVGCDIRDEQLEANRTQAHRGGHKGVEWRKQDATAIADAPDGYLPAEVDLIFSCPPYADLEVYSDDPRDISTWSYEDFVRGHAAAIAGAVDRLRPNRYAAWVIGEVRDKKTGAYRGLVAETIRAFIAAGCSFLNEFIILDPAATAAIRAERPFVANRKATKVHQNLLIFVKGSIGHAAAWANDDLDD